MGQPSGALTQVRRFDVFGQYLTCLTTLLSINILCDFSVVLVPTHMFGLLPQGRYVALCSHPLFLVGVDVAAPRAERPGGGGCGRGAVVPADPVRRPLQAHLAAFRSQLADSEVGRAGRTWHVTRVASPWACRRQHVSQLEPQGLQVLSQHQATDRLTNAVIGPALRDTTSLLRPVASRPAPLLSRSGRCCRAWPPTSSGRRPPSSACGA